MKKYTTNAKTWISRANEIAGGLSFV